MFICCIIHFVHEIKSRKEEDQNITNTDTQYVVIINVFLCLHFSNQKKRMHEIAQMQEVPMLSCVKNDASVLFVKLNRTIFMAAD